VTRGDLIFIGGALAGIFTGAAIMLRDIWEEIREFIRRWRG